MAGLLLIAAVLTLVWGVVFLRRFGLLGGAVAVLVVGSCFGHPFFHREVGPLPITADRVLLGVLLLVYVLYRQRHRVAFRPLDGADLALVCWIGFLVVSTFTHDWRAEGHRALASLLFLHLMPLALYGIVRDVPCDARALRGVMAAMAAFGLYLAVTAVCEQQRWWGLVFPRYIVSAVEAEFLGRGRGPFLNPVANGLYLCAGFFSLLMFWPRVGRAGKAWLLMLSLVYLAGVYCTLTRVVWLAAVAGVLVIIVLALPRRWGLTCATAVLVVGCGVAAVKWQDLNAFKRDEHVSLADMSQSARLRPILAYIAGQMFWDRPLAGCGYRQYDTVADYYLTDRSTSLELERARPFVQHNVFLSLLAETGLMGVGLLLIWLAALAAAAWRLWRHRAADLAARQVGLLVLLLLLSYVLMGLFHDLALIPMVHMLLLFWAGVARAAALPVAVQESSVAAAAWPDLRWASHPPESACSSAD
jgi:O-antigen ligase